MKRIILTTLVLLSIAVSSNLTAEIVLSDTKSTPPVSYSSFRLGEYQVVALHGPASLLNDAKYISFTGDFGFRHDYGLPSKEILGENIRYEKELLSNFDINIINLEFMLPGIGFGDSKMVSEFESFRKLPVNTLSDSYPDKMRKTRGLTKSYFYLEYLMLDMLKQSGFHAVSFANNHALDYGVHGIPYNCDRLKQYGIGFLGTKDKPHLQIRFGNKRGVVIGMTDLVDKNDKHDLIMKFNTNNLAMIKQKIEDFDFAIGFIHIIANKSVYPSPYELEQIDHLVDAGFDLIICTGSHWVKGFSFRRGKPVVFGIGNYLFSYAKGWTESIGIHFVAGFQEGKIVQLFAIPFFNKIKTGEIGPLTSSDFQSFLATFRDRSQFSETKFYRDRRAISELKQRIIGSRLNYSRNISGKQFYQDLKIIFFHIPALLQRYRWLFLSLILLTVVFAVYKAVRRPP